VDLALRFDRQHLARALMARRDGRTATNRDAKGVRCMSLTSMDVTDQEELSVQPPKADGVVGYESLGSSCRPSLRFRRAAWRALIHRANRGSPPN
jgi:hypothetical protein